MPRLIQISFDNNEECQSKPVRLGMSECDEYIRLYRVLVNIFYNDCAM